MAAWGHVMDDPWSERGVVETYTGGQCRQFYSVACHTLSRISRASQMTARTRRTFSSVSTSTLPRIRRGVGAASKSLLARPWQQTVSTCDPNPGDEHDAGRSPGLAGARSGRTGRHGRDRRGRPAAAQVDIDADSVTLRADVQADGDARWVVTYRLPLDDENATQA